MMTHWRSFFLALCLVALLGCQGGNQLSDEGATGPQDSTAQREEVKIGVILGLTGQYSQYGKRMKAGYDLALEALESRAGQYRLTLLEEDSKFDPAAAVRAYQQLHSVRGVEIYAGITGSKNAAAVCAVSASDDIVIVDPLSSAPILTERCNENYFRIMPSDALAGRYNVDWAAEQGFEQFAIVHVLDDWGNSYAEQVARYLEERGLDLTLREGVQPGERDYSAIVRKIESSDAEALFLLLYASDGATFMQQLRTRDERIQVFGSDNLSTDEFLAAGESVVEGTALALPATVEGPANVRLKQAYEEYYDGSPPEGVQYDVNVTKAYGALMLLAQAIEKVGPNPGKIREYLRTMPEYNSVSGPISFDENGDLAFVEYERFEFKNGERVLSSR